MREIKFRAWDTINKVMRFNASKIKSAIYWDNGESFHAFGDQYELMQSTGLLDKNGLTEVYEGDIIDENGLIKGSIYEMDKRETDIVIPQLGTKAWESAYKEAVVRGFNYSE